MVMYIRLCQKRSLAFEPEVLDRAVWVAHLRVGTVDSQNKHKASTEE